MKNNLNKRVESVKRHKKRRSENLKWTGTAKFQIKIKTCDNYNTNSIHPRLKNINFSLYTKSFEKILFVFSLIVNLFIPFLLRTKKFFIINLIAVILISYLFLL